MIACWPGAVAKTGVVGFWAGTTGSGGWIGVVCIAAYCCSLGVTAVAAAAPIGVAVVSGAGCSAGLAIVFVAGYWAGSIVSLGRFVSSVSIWIPLLCL